MKPHKHAELIKAWADGAEIEEWKETVGEWGLDKYPTWAPWNKYRVKPKEKIVRWLWVYRSAMTEDLRVSGYKTEDEAFQSWHGVTFHKKLEWSREEFDE